MGRQVSLATHIFSLHSNHGCSDNNHLDYFRYWRKCLNMMLMRQDLNLLVPCWVMELVWPGEEVWVTKSLRNVSCDTNWINHGQIQLLWVKVPFDFGILGHFHTYSLFALVQISRWVCKLGAFPLGLVSFHTQKKFKQTEKLHYQPCENQRFLVRCVCGKSKKVNTGKRSCALD